VGGIVPHLGRLVAALPPDNTAYGQRLVNTPTSSIRRFSSMNNAQPSPGLRVRLPRWQPLTFFTKTSSVTRNISIRTARLFGLRIHHPPYIRHVLSDNARNYGSSESYAIYDYIGGNGLVTNEGKSWRHQRRLIQPAFSQAALDRACAVMWRNGRGRASTRGPPGNDTRRVGDTRRADDRHRRALLVQQ
jgi:hypothetical protein